MSHIYQTWQGQVFYEKFRLLTHDIDPNGKSNEF